MNTASIDRWLSPEAKKEIFDAIQLAAAWDLRNMEDLPELLKDYYPYDYAEEEKAAEAQVAYAKVVLQQFATLLEKVEFKS